MFSPGARQRAAQDDARDDEQRAEEEDEGDVLVQRVDDDHVVVLGDPRHHRESQGGAQDCLVSVVLPEVRRDEGHQRDREQGTSANGNDAPEGEQLGDAPRSSTRTRCLAPRSGRAQRAERERVEPSRRSYHSAHFETHALRASRACAPQRSTGAKLRPGNVGADHRTDSLHGTQMSSRLSSERQASIAAFCAVVARTHCVMAFGRVSKVNVEPSARDHFARKYLCVAVLRVNSCARLTPHARGGSASACGCAAHWPEQHQSRR